MPLTLETRNSKLGDIVAFPDGYQVSSFKFQVSLNTIGRDVSKIVFKILKTFLNSIDEVIFEAIRHSRRHL